MYIAVHSHSYLDFLHIYDVLVIGREIALPVWLLDVLECCAAIFFGFSPVLMIWFDLDNLT